jgi:prolyl-tRNA editing enzyme YbaK/EbsC (Cys-tRNA(Pro) deacylase)
MTAKVNRSLDRVRSALIDLGLEAEIRELPESTRTAQQAAEAVGCHVDQIAKSLVFRGLESDKAYLVITSGANRVDTDHLRGLVGEAIKMADPTFVRETTGFSIGGVAPIGLLGPVEKLIDADLLVHDEIWAAAGTPHAVFRLTPAQLQQIAGSTIIAVG